MLLRGLSLLLPFLAGIIHTILKHLNTILMTTQNIKIHTSESLTAQDGDFENFHYQLNDGEKYLLTDDENGWLLFNKGKYSINDHIFQNSEMTEKGRVYTVDTIGMSEALEGDDSSYKAVMLSDKTTLQSIFFYSNIND